ncbi:MAG: GH3 auxin-responsive promoter family protein [Terracidiphilus sp.]|jgi:hypothetical protein
MICLLANSLWATGCIPEYARFRRAIHRVAEEQEAVLCGILRKNADTEFGRTHGFSSIRSSGEFQRRVPIRDYDQHQRWIERAENGIPSVLTREAIRLFEPTSGSSGGTKLIPYTRSLQCEFQRGIQAWIADLFAHFPELLGGPAYWSISPPSARGNKTSGGIAIGFDDDTSYLGGWRKSLVRSVMAVPGSVSLESDSEEFIYVTLLYLLCARDLRLISIWSPTYLLLMLDRLTQWRDRISFDLEHGTHFNADNRRSREAQEALRAGSPQDIYARLWPKLKLISCWTDANAAGPAAKLAGLFPLCRVQGKGLIATEAFISFPFIGHEGATLSLRSHFLEFLSSGSEHAQRAHELDLGGFYRVIVTTGGGLYRYMLGDQIQVTGRIENCPLVRFVGRLDSVSDWFGEKLNDAHVSRAFKDAFKNSGVVPSFAMLACDTTPPAGYVLYIDADGSGELIAQAAAAIEADLRDNFHYDYARRLGQLASVRAVRIRDGARLYMKDAVRNGQKMGDVKAPALNRRGGWSSVFGVETDKERRLP